MPIAKVVLLVERKALVVQSLVLLVKITISASTIRTFCKVALIFFRPVSPIEHKEIKNLSLHSFASRFYCTVVLEADATTSFLTPRVPTAHGILHLVNGTV